MNEIPPSSPMPPSENPTGAQGPNPAPPSPAPAGGGNLDAKQWAMFLHLSSLAGMIVVGVGFATPIVIWQIKKEQFPELNPHGMMVTNWIISLAIYYLVASIIGSLTCVGFLLLVPVSILAIVFPILGGLKARDGILWKYPLTITFLK
jgi:uncharacterized protein